LAKSQINLLITDLDMPGMGGVELLQEVRSRGMITRCIVVTGYATIGNLTACLREGAVALVPKPLRSFDLLDQAVALAFEQTRMWVVQMKAIVAMKTEPSELEPRRTDAR
jgi:DNA-binding NarL/FixJ family response regulator